MAKSNYLFRLFSHMPSCFLEVRIFVTFPETICYHKFLILTIVGVSTLRRLVQLVQSIELEDF
jgi:hypothetical protein